MTNPTGTALDREESAMTDRLDEIRKRLGIGEGQQACGYQGQEARQDIAYLLAEVDRLQSEVVQYTVCMDCGHLYADGVCRPDICRDSRGWPD